SSDSWLPHFALRLMFEVPIQTDAFAEIGVAARGTPSFVAEFLEACALSRRSDCGTLRVLDVGAGSARIPVALCRQRADIAVIAVDQSARALRRAAGTIRQADLQDRIGLVLADARSLPFPSASCDAVISNGLVHYLRDPAGLLREMLRVLRPGGLVLVRDS